MIILHELAHSIDSKETLDDFKNNSAGNTSTKINRMVKTACPGIE